MLQDRISLIQALVSPKIVFWLLLMPWPSQLPLGIPVAPGIRWVPVVFICQQADLPRMDSSSAPETWGVLLAAHVPA